MNEKIKKICDFCLGFFGMFLIIGVIYILMLTSNIGYGLLLIAILIVPALVGFILWVKFRGKKKMLALGLLLGGFVPLTFVFLVIGSCGLILG